MWSLHGDSRQKTPHAKSQTGHNGAFCINIILILLLLLSDVVHPNPGPNRRKKSIDICHINARSLRTYYNEKCSYIKYEEIESHAIHSMKSDIVCISETWMDNSIPDIAVHIPDYDIHRNDRNRHGGGVAFYITNGLVVKRRPDLEHNDYESFLLQILTDRKHILLGTYYRPPVSQVNRSNIVYDFINKLHATLLSALATNSDCILLVGDFNDRCSQRDETTRTVKWDVNYLIR